MQHYFKKHEYGNTTITDFLAALEYGYTQTVTGSHIDLTRWASFWLETSVIHFEAPFSHSPYRASIPCHLKFNLKREKSLTLQSTNLQCPPNTPLFVLTQSKSLSSL